MQRLRDRCLRLLGVVDDAGRPDLLEGDDEDAPADEVGAIASALSEPEPEPAPEPAGV